MNDLSGTYVVEVAYRDLDAEQIQQGTRTYGPFRSKESAQRWAAKLGESMQDNGDESGVDRQVFIEAYALERPLVRKARKEIAEHLNPEDEDW